MIINLFGIIEYRPFWEKQYIDDDNIGLTMLFGIFGFTISFWFILSSFLANFGVQFLQSIDYEIHPMLLLLTNGWVNLIIAVLIASISNILIQRYMSVFEGFNFVNETESFLTIAQSTLEEEGKNPKLILPLTLSVLFISGVVTGFLYSIVLLVPYFILFFLLLFIFGVFLEVGSLLIVLSSMSSWIVFYFYSIRRKTELYLAPEPKSSHFQPITRRDIEIIHSDDPPVICGNCRSFISADKKICPVCNEKVESTST